MDIFWNYTDNASLQILFVYRQVICQARGQFLLDKKPDWLDKIQICLKKLNFRETNLLTHFGTFQYFNWSSDYLNFIK